MTAAFPVFCSHSPNPYIKKPTFTYYRDYWLIAFLAHDVTHVLIISAVDWLAQPALLEC